MAAMRHVSIERRRGNSDAVDVQYRKYIDDADSTEVHSFYSIKYARYLTKVLLLYCWQTSRSDVAERPCDALCPSVVSLNKIITRVEFLGQLPKVDLIV